MANTMTRNLIGNPLLNSASMSANSVCCQTKLEIKNKKRIFEFSNLIVVFSWIKNFICINYTCRIPDNIYNKRAYRDAVKYW
jgi:hypothetical protein